MLRATSFVSVALLAAADPCCNACEAPLVKYFSVDVPHGFCGEACMDPKKFSIYKVFEKNLTLAESDTPCAEQFTPTGTHYTKYSETVTHGVPGLLAVTLDLYGPSESTQAVAGSATKLDWSDSALQQSGCSGTDDFPAYPACYGNNVLGQEDVVLKIEDFSAGAGHFSFKGTGGAELECETAFAKDSENKMTFDNCDVSGYAKVKGAQYCSDTDELKATFNPLGVPVPVSVKFPKIACPSVVEVAEEQSGCSGTDDFPAYPACYGNNVLGQEDVVLKIEDFSAGAGHFSFKGTGGAELECETAFAKDSENKMTFDNCDVSGYAKVKGAQYCSDTDELKATFNPLGVPVPVSVKFPKIACPSVVEV